MDHELHTTLELPLPVDEVFSFFAEAGNLHRITPPELRFEILTPLPLEMGRGTLLEYRLGLFGVPFRWRTRIAAWDPPHGFVDVQLSGPYAVWEHTHVFAATETGTLIDDRVRYRLPCRRSATSLTRWSGASSGGSSRTDRRQCGKRCSAARRCRR